MKYVFQRYRSPVGTLSIVATPDALVSVWFGEVLAKGFEQAEENRNEIIRLTIKQLEEYFAGKRTSFDIPVAPIGTEFQKQVWKSLNEIPFGKTATYGDQALKLGKPSASRAVGAANGKNPIPIIIPCHRVIGADGSLTGFSGGLDIKKKLLRLENSEF